MRHYVMDCAVQWKWRLRDYDKQSDHIIKYSCHRVTYMWPVMRVSSDLPRRYISVTGCKWEMCGKFLRRKNRFKGPWCLSDLSMSYWSLTVQDLILSYQILLYIQDLSLNYWSLTVQDLILSYQILLYIQDLSLNYWSLTIQDLILSYQILLYIQDLSLNYQSLTLQEFNIV